MKKEIIETDKNPNQYITVLGIAQDAGFPHIDCDNNYCNAFYNGSENKKLVSCLGFVDLLNKQKRLFDAAPDIDKWHVWKKDIIEEVKKVDYAFLDASFFRDGEIARDMSKIPHPFTTETTTLFENEDIKTKNKIYSIYFNHSNPTILDSHPLKDSFQNLGFHFAKEGDVFAL